MAYIKEVEVAAQPIEQPVTFQTFNRMDHAELWALFEELRQRIAYFEGQNRELAVLNDRMHSVVDAAVAHRAAEREVEKALDGPYPSPDFGSAYEAESEKSWELARAVDKYTEPTK